MGTRQLKGSNMVLARIVSAERAANDCKCKECSYPSCHDPIWNESFCQYHYNEEHYLSR